MRMSRRGALHSSVGGRVEVAFTGEMAEIPMNVFGKNWRLLALLSTGTLSLSKEVKGHVWLCGGGENGVEKIRGGNGAKFAEVTNVTISKSTVAVVAAGNSISGTSFGDIVPTTDGSGGGAFGHDKTGKAGIGGHVSTIPFGDNENFLKLCAAGGGGTFQKHGGVGGSNGSDGGDVGGYPTVGSQGNTIAGGADGGGHGGKKGNGHARESQGGNGLYYGDGGGNAGAYMNNNSEIISGTQGKGSQGVIYVLIPDENEEGAA